MLRILVFLIYVAVCSFSYWHFIPQLSTTSKRLTTFLLAANVLVTILALDLQPASEWGGWLWHLDEEQNISSTLATAQLALVSGAALLTGWFAHARPKWQRIYLVGLGLLFLYFAIDEYYSVRMTFESWGAAYRALSVAVSVPIMFAVARAPRNERKWHILLFVGLALGASGAILLEELRIYATCRPLRFFFLGRCHLFAVEESLEFLGIWLALIAMLGLYSSAIPRPRPIVRLMMYALPALWIIIIPLWLVFLHLEGVLTALPASVKFESETSTRGVHLYAYRLNFAESSVMLRSYAIARRGTESGLGLSVNLVDQATGASFDSLNRHWDRDAGPLIGPGGLRIYRQLASMEIPPATPRNRALWVTLAIWRKLDGRHVFDSIVSSDQRLLGESQVILGEVVIPATSPLPSTSAPAAVFDNGFRLGAVDMPESAQAGEALAIPFFWSADAAGSEDYAQFLHFGHEESGKWWVYDQEPLGPRLPTRLWYTGLVDDETWEIPLPADLAPGRYRVFTGLYRQSDSERVPASEPNGTPFVDSRVPLGSIIIE